MTGQRHPGKFENWSVRAGLKAALSDTISVLLRYQHSDTDDPTYYLVNSTVDRSGEAGFFRMVSPAGQAIYGKSSSVGLPLANLNTPRSLIATAPNDIASNLGLVFRSKSDTIQGTVKADLGFADLTSYTQYRKDKSVNIEDLDATGAPGFDIYIGIKNETISQEFLLNSQPGSRLQWTAGLNYFQNKDDWSDIRASLGGSPFFPLGGSSTKTKSYAAFADLTYEIMPSKLFLTLGGRFSHDEVTDAFFITNAFTPFTGYEGPNGQNVPSSGPPGTVIGVPDLKDDSFTPRVVVRYKPTSQSSIYASYTRGFKAGILNVGGSSQQPIAPETNDAFEAGFKFDNRQFSFDMAGFYYSYKNLQVSSFQNGAARIRNAASAEIYGLEGQARYRVDNHLTVNGGASWTHARYKSFTNAPYYSYCDPSVTSFANPLICTQGPGGITETTTNASGFHMQRSPDFTANLGMSYGFDMAEGRTTLSSNLYYTSKFYFDPEQQFPQKGYALLSLRAQWVDSSNRFTVAAFGNNVTNKQYQVQVLANTTGVASVWSAPATYGIELGAKF